MEKTKMKQIVKISSGEIAGYLNTDKDVQIFKGIPYAAPPVGPLRFKAPVKHPIWNGVKECTEFGKSPIQKDLDHMFDDLWTKEFIVSAHEWSEDCLTMNIWAPVDKKDCPVVLYFFGGGFVSGGSSCEIYDGTSLAKKGVIYVTFNHRVGTLSLFANEDLSNESETKKSGNCDLMDAIFALKWIQENIHNFGGDSNNVTIWGQSSGASEVLALSTSKAAKGLFKNVVAMGYNCFVNFSRPWNTTKEAYESSNNLLKEMNITLDELKRVDPIEFTNNRILDRLIVDGHIVEDKFAPMVKSGATNHVSIIMGAVPGDAMMGGLFKLAKPATKEEMLIPMKEFFKDDFDRVCQLYDVDKEEMPVIIRKINEDNLIASQIFFANERKKAGTKNNTYTYYFTHPMPGPNSKIYGTFHSAEVPYFMNYFTPLRDEYWTKEDFDFGEYLSEVLVDYIKTGSIDDKAFKYKTDTDYSLLDAKDNKVISFSEEKYAIWVRGYQNQDRDY